MTLLTGCASDPFTRPPLPELVKPNARVVAAEFDHYSAPQFTSEDSVIIKAPFHDALAVLGVVNIDRSAGKYEVVGMSQLGIELFHLTGDRTGPTVQSVIPQLAEQKDVLLSIGQDIYRIFFEIVPPKDSSFEVKSDHITYEQNDIEYLFGGKPTVLLEKRQTGTWGDKWRVQYFDYTPAGEQLYPRGIVMDNGHYHYRVTIKNKSWTPE